MSGFRTYGTIDDRQDSGGDRAFFRVNGRLEPHQLGEGEVASSLNGRMDRGVWRVRRGIESVSGALQLSADPLRVPFFLADESGGFDGGDYLTVSGTLTPDATGDYYLNDYNGSAFWGDDVDGAGQPASYPWVGITATENVGGDWFWRLYYFTSISGIALWDSDDTYSTESELRLNPPDGVSAWSAGVGATGTPTVASNTASVSVSRVDETVTVTTGEHPFPNLAVGYLGLEGATGTVSPNGIHEMTIASPSTLTFEISGATGSETYGGTIVLRSVISDDDAAAVFGSCLFSDPASDSAEFIIVALNNKAIKVALADGSQTDIAYPTGVTLSSRVELIQAFDRVFMFRPDGAQSLEWRTPSGRAVEAAARATNVVTATVTDHGLTVGDTVAVSGVNFSGDDPNGSFTVASTPDGDTFTYASTGSDETFTVDADSVMVSGFTKVRAGAYSQPQVFEVTGSSVSVTSGLLTATVSGNTTILAGDRIALYGSDDSRFLDLLGRQFTVVSASSTEIKFYIPVEDMSGIGAATLSFGRNVSVGGGFCHMPAPPWATYHQRRLICPYRYTQTGTTASPTFTDRDVRDEIVFSDILDPDTFDPLANQFRITAGVADFTVALQPFYEDTLLVFNRNSIHAAFGISGSLSDVSVRELTREIGCLARRSIITHGAQILFLSDNGVFSVGFIDEYNLRGSDVPLSEAIQPTIDRINSALAVDAVGIYFDNRYYLAVPLDSSEGANDATGNNAVIVYNFLNKGWESIDTVNADGWNIIGFHVGRADGRNRLYAVNDLGGVHRLEGDDSDTDELSLTPGGADTFKTVVGTLITRQYDFGTTERKRFSRVQLDIGSTHQESDGTLSVLTQDPDGTVLIGELSTVVSGGIPASEDVSVRARIGGKRGKGAQVQLVTSGGRPKVSSVAVDAAITNRQTTTQQ